MHRDFEDFIRQLYLLPDWFIRFMRVLFNQNLNFMMKFVDCFGHHSDQFVDFEFLTKFRFVHYLRLADYFLSGTINFRSEVLESV